MFNILIVEDDPSARRLMEAVLKENGFHTYLAANGLEALDVLDQQQIDLMVTDLMMPEMNGYDLTEQLREAQFDLPVLMVTAREAAKDKRKGFLVGTDDYIVKPFDEEELVLRIKALLRRAQIVSERKLTIGPVTLDYDGLTVRREAEVVELPPKEFQLLYKLLSSPNVIFTRAQLMDELWGMDSESGDHTVSVHIGRLRERFGEWPEFDLETVRGLGYKAVRRV